MFWKVPEASAHDSDTKSSRKPRTYARSKEFWKLLENAGTWAGAAGVCVTAHPPAAQQLVSVRPTGVRGHGFESPAA